ncbi:AI-2E family transporter [Latilactobacillus sakei]
MFERLRQSKLLFWSTELLILAVLIFVCTKISFLFDPIGTFISTLFGPIIGAGLLFYLFNPLINLLGKLKISRKWAIAIIFIVFFGGIIFIVALAIPQLIHQVTQVVTNLPDYVHRLQDMIDKISTNPHLKNIDVNKYVNQLDLKPSKIAENIMKSFTSGFGSDDWGRDECDDWCLYRTNHALLYVKRRSSTHSKYSKDVTRSL